MRKITSIFVSLAYFAKHKDFPLLSLPANTMTPFFLMDEQNSIVLV